MKQNIIYTRTKSGFTYQRLQDVKKYSNIDILFIGSSRAYRSFDVRQYSNVGLTTFNLGTSNQTPLQSYYLLKKYFQKLSPKIIVMEINPDIISNDGTESTLDLLSNESIDWQLLSLIIQSKNIKCFNTLIFSFFSNLILNEKNVPKSTIEGKDHYVAGGFVENSDSKFYSEKGKNYTCNISDLQLETIENISKYSLKNHTRLILIQSPITNFIYSNCTQNIEFDNIVSRKYEYYNFNLKEQLVDVSNFSDNQHLNQKGVEIFNKSILEILQSKLK